MTSLSRNSVAALGLATCLFAPALAPALAHAQDVEAQGPAQADQATAPAPTTRRGPPPEVLENSIFNRDWVSVGVGAAFSPSYDGSDDYNFNVLPIVQGSLGGVRIAPRPGGLALDFIEDPEEGTGFDLGIAARVRGNRNGNIDDPVVASLGELDTAVEVGPTIGVTFPKVLIPVDSLSLSLDARWDVAGAHNGMVIAPSVTYSTPLNLGTFAALSLGTEYVDSDFAEYNYSVSAAGSAVSGLPQFDAGSGFTSVSATLILGFDLSGNALDGGWGITTITGYSRLIGDAADTPLTSVRGSADQAFVAVGVAYAF